MSNSSHQSFTELIAWQQARKLKNDIYKLVQGFPDGEKYRLTDQIIRASRSIGANIAEGHGRYSYKEQLRFCIQARGSLSEVHHHLIDAFDCNYISSDLLAEYRKAIDETGKLLNGYITFLRNNVNLKTES